MSKTLDHSCIDEKCGRAFPRAVAFCPYCGLNQTSTPTSKIVDPKPRKPKAVEPVAIAITPNNDSKAEVEKEVTNTSSGEEKPPVIASIEPIEPLLATKIGDPVAPKKHSGQTKWFVGVGIALIFFWWLGSSGNDNVQIEEEVAAAITAARECKIEAAEVQLVTLQNGKASVAQLQSVKQALAKYRTACAIKAQRESSLNDAKAAVMAGLGTTMLAKAEVKLDSYIRRWGDDAETRELKDVIAGDLAKRILNEVQVCIDAKNFTCALQRLATAEQKGRPELRDQISAMRESIAQNQEQLKSNSVLTTAAVTTQPSAPAPNAVNTSSDYITGLLRESEVALASKKYREAMTNANNVLRLDPNSRAAKSILERARNAEFKALQEGTEIQ